MLASEDLMPRMVSVCVVTHNRRAQLARAINSVARQTHRLIEIVLVDNASTDGTAGFMRESYPHVRLIRSHRNLGCPVARNLAMANTRGEFIAHLDDDGVLEDDAIALAAAMMGEHPDAGVVMLNVTEDGRSLLGNVINGATLPTFIGGANLMRAEAVRRIGLFEDTILRQGEEHDMAIRLFEAGYLIYYCREAVMQHLPLHLPKQNMGFLAQEMLNKSLTLVRYAPLSTLVMDLPRRVLGYGLLMARRRAMGEYLLGLARFTSAIPRTLRERKVMRNGYQVYKRLLRKNR